MFLAVFKMEERHEVLWNSIGYLQEEQDALDRGKLIRNTSLSCVIIGSIIETIFFSLYNNKFHPMADILKEVEPEGNFGVRTMNLT